MEITEGTGPRYCARCNRHIDTAIRDQVQAHEPCPDGQCTFRKEIKAALEEKAAPPKFTILPSKSRPPRFKIVPLCSSRK